MNIGPTWTDTRTELLKGLWHDGLSCSQIGSEMGVSRNAVIGKLHRMGITKASRAEASLRSRPVRRKPKQIRMYRGAWPAATSEVEIVPDVEITDLAPDTSEFACTIAALGLISEMSQCRYPLGDPAADMQYCGAASVGPWCPRHRCIVYKRLGAR